MQTDCPPDFNGNTNRDDLNYNFSNAANKKRKDS